MRKFYLLLALTGFGLQAFAQTFVSTKAEKKNVVLEEFTGIHCTYCPDGHKRAQALKEANPGDVVLINIHQGGYANPATGEPDFRTPWGDAIAAQTSLTGYPAGTVNRHAFAVAQTAGGTAQGRGDWANSASQILAENSPVNVAIQTTLDMVKREITIVAEVYYTGNAKNASNKLNIAILQSNVEGPQTGATSFYPENILPNGNYNHQHMLRDLVTGQWGETISTTSAGSFFTKTYVYSIPADIKSVPMMMQFLEVAAFVAEGNQEILSGVSQVVEIPEANKVDMAMVNNTVIDNADICSETIAPKVTISNESDNTVESFNISAYVNGVEYKKVFNGSLAKGESTEMAWDEMNLPGGNYSVRISAPSNVNGGTLIDTELGNSSDLTIAGFSFLPEAITAPYEATFNGSTPSSFGFDQSQNAAWGILYNTSYPYGAKGSYGTLRYYLHSSWNVAGKPANVLFGKADLSQTSNPNVSYWYAYSDGGQGGTAPTIKIEVSTDCGASWKTVHTENARETGQPADPSQLYQPSFNHYRRIYASLDAYKNDEVIVKLSMTPGTSGNAMWIDEINLVSDAASIEEVAAQSFEVYPNPFQNQTNIAFELETGKNIEVKVYDALGRVVSTIAAKEYAAGAHTVNIETANLENGFYVLKIESNGTAFIHSGEKFDVLKKENVTIGIKSPWKSFDDEMNLYLKLAGLFMDKWTVSSAELVQIIFNNPSITQEEIGKQLGIKQNSVSGRWNRANVNEILEINKMFQKKVKTLM